LYLTYVMKLRIIIAALVLVTTWVWLSANWVTYTEEELATLEQNNYDWPIFIGDERINQLVQYAYNKCLEVIGDTNWYYSCVNMVLTFDSENGAWGWWVVSPTDDYGICALHYKWHKDFIDDKERFENPHNQIDYCVGVRQNSMQRNKMPWMAYGNRNAARSRFIITK